MRIVFDVDGVLADFIRGFTTVAHNLFGTEIYGTHDQHTWDDLAGLSKGQMDIVWEHIKEDPEFWLRLWPLVTPFEFARINDLEVMGHDVYFATSRLGVAPKRQTELWLKNHGVPHPTVVVTSLKGEFAKVVQASALIDDKAGNAVAVQYLSPLTLSYLIDRPYNRFDQSVLGSKVKRVQSVAEFIEKVTEFDEIKIRSHMHVNPRLLRG